jgi:hypothetical protein
LFAFLFSLCIDAKYGIRCCSPFCFLYALMQNMAAVGPAEKEECFTTTTLVPLRAQMTCPALRRGTEVYVAIYSKVFFQAGLVLAAVLLQCSLEPDPFPDLWKKSTAKGAKRIMDSCMHVGTKPYVRSGSEKKLEPIVERVWETEFARRGFEVSRVIAIRHFAYFPTVCFSRLHCRKFSFLLA